MSKLLQALLRLLLERDSCLHEQSNTNPKPLNP